MAGRGSLFARIAGAGETDRPVVVGPAGTLTRADLLTRARRLSSCLGKHGGPVIVYGHKEPAMVVGFLAALRVGRAYVPVDSSLPVARVARMLDAAKPTHAVLADSAPAALARELAARGIGAIAVGALATDVAPSAAVNAGDPPAPSPAEIAYILFTSGTTGVPKGVAVPHRALEHFTDWLLALCPYVPGGETFLNQAPFGFDLSVMELYGALLTGGTLFMLDREETADPRRLFQRLDGAPLTTWVSTPSFARLCLAERRFGRSMLPALRRFLFCGEPLAGAVAGELLARFPSATVWNLYGPTETTVAVTAVEITPALAGSGRPLPVGRAAPGIDIWVADRDEATRPVPDGERGEIVIAGPQVAGYLDTTDAGPFITLRDGRRAYRTGDLGFVDPADGSLFCAGRLDRQIKLRGHRLELEEIEAHLRAVEGVTDAAVVAVERDAAPDHLVAFVVGLSGDGADLTARVRATLAASLPDYALPRRVRRVAALPVTAHGK